MSTRARIGQPSAPTSTAPTATWGLDLLTFRRLGGNRMTGYNWETNASNAGSDWNQSSDNYMCSVQGLTTACSTAGSVITAWQDQSVAMSAASELTVQMAGYVAADMNGDVAQSETAPSRAGTPLCRLRAALLLFRPAWATERCTWTSR